VLPFRLAESERSLVRYAASTIDFPSQVNAAIQAPIQAGIIVVASSRRRRRARFLVASPSFRSIYLVLGQRGERGEGRERAFCQAQCCLAVSSVLLTGITRAHCAGTHVPRTPLGISSNECARYEAANAIQGR